MDFHVLTTHQAGPDDWTPMHMVSAEQVAYWKRIEADYLALQAKVVKPVTAIAPIE